jgi:phosphohistidine phosphatase
MAILILVRHGEAAVPGPSFGDRARPLTEKGNADVTRLAADLQSTVNATPVICHSPYTRAMQTATLIHERLGGTLTVNDDLVPNGILERARDIMLSHEQPLLLVSHMPLVAELAEAVTGRRLPFFPGSALCIQRSDPFATTGVVLWIKHPSS